jgi:hypothetical protein
MKWLDYVGFSSTGRSESDDAVDFQVKAYGAVAPPPGPPLGAIAAATVVALLTVGVAYYAFKKK